MVKQTRAKVWQAGRNSLRAKAPVKGPTEAEKLAIGAICDRFITDVLKPRFLPVIRPTEHNYAIDFLGKWRGSKYSFITRYRSGFPENIGKEFDAPYTRLDHVAEHPDGARFNLMWLRHTGQWWPMDQGVTLDEALHLIAADGVLRPLV